MGRRGRAGPPATLRRPAELLAAGPVWIPEPGPRHPEILGELVLRHQVRGNLVPGAQLAALALEHGLTVLSADTDFARFTDVRWENPLAGSVR